MKAFFRFATFPDDTVPGAAGLAIKYIETVDQARAVLFCTVTDINEPVELECVIGFVNAPFHALAALDLGFPVVDAVIDTVDDCNIEIRCPAFGKGPDMDYQTKVATVSGMGWVNKFDDSEITKSSIDFKQPFAIPDSIFPATLLRSTTYTWQLSGGYVEEAKSTGPVVVALGETRFPVLTKFEVCSREPTALRSGTFDLDPGVVQRRAVDGGRLKRQDSFGLPLFRFEDVEVLGCRIEMGRHGAELEELNQLCRTLNWHLEPFPEGDLPASAMSDFSYQVASRTLMLEVLRYGKMKVTADSESPIITPDDTQSQHELLLRMLVGRVDDDTAQARDAATFVPTIFVDNTWSKTIGRTLQGFDKRLAEFCIARDDDFQPLDPTGRAKADECRSNLGDLRLVRMAGIPGRLNQGNELVALEPDPASSADAATFIDVDLDLAYSPFGSGLTRWRQSDFEGKEFRRSFAAPSLRKNLRGFRSVQVSPVAPNPLRGTEFSRSAWIRGEFRIDRNAKIAWPDGVMRLQIYDPLGAPEPWRTFCRLLGCEMTTDLNNTKSVKLTLPPGSWYRMQFSTDFIVSDNI